MMVVWPAICTSTHLILTGSILYGLYRTREGANHTRVMVDRIIFMSLESQVPATVLYVAFMISRLWGACSHSAVSLPCSSSLPTPIRHSSLGSCMLISVIQDVVTDIQYRPSQGIPHWLYRHGQRPTHLATRRQIALYPRCKFIPRLKQSAQAGPDDQSGGVRKFSGPPRLNRSQGSSDPSDTVGTPTRGETPRTGPIMLSSFDEEDGPGMQLGELGKPIELEVKDKMDSDRDSISNYKVEHMA